LTKDKYVDEIKARNNFEVAIFNGDTPINTTLINEQGEREAGMLASDEIINAVIERKEDYPFRIPLFGVRYAAYFSPLIKEGNVIGMLFVGVNIDHTLVAQKNMMNNMLLMASISGVISIGLMFLFSIFSISKPLKKIGVFAEMIKTGDLGIASSSAAIIEVQSSDEVGILARTLEHAYAQLKGYVGEIRERMHGLSGGDLATETAYDFHGDFILIRDSINEIVNNLSRTMSEVNSSSSQVSKGAKLVADGAHALAQGSTKQAASIQELSASVSDIAGKTRINAEMAGRAASLANSIMVNAQAGSQQMDEMMVAVREINTASQNIGKVIKVIDDIAFQTNILALNAAVEAARAGEHGKGFAVVAEEVRNLAAKSAEAAKETSEMIQNSIDKAELGARIAGETAESLTEIVSGIAESTQIVAEIAQSSEEQTLAINQINAGIDQVAHVVQQNSATAEESAAASEEMSSQSDLLSQLIAQFRLGENGAMPMQKRLA
jgi:methyl-accepting chemotaxis protein